MVCCCPCRRMLGQCPAVDAFLFAFFWVIPWCLNWISHTCLTLGHLLCDLSLYLSWYVRTIPRILVQRPYFGPTPIFWSNAYILPKSATCLIFIVCRVTSLEILVVKLLPCCGNGKLSSGYFPAVWVLKADVSEHCVSSIFNRWWSISPPSEY